MSLHEILQIKLERISNPRTLKTRKCFVSLTLKNDKTSIKNQPRYKWVNCNI